MMSHKYLVAKQRLNYAPKEGSDSGGGHVCVKHGKLGLAKCKSFVLRGSTWEEYAHLLNQQVVYAEPMRQVSCSSKPPHTHAPIVTSQAGN